MIPKVIYFDVRQLEMQGIAIQKYRSFVLTLLWNPHHQVNFFFAAICADWTECLFRWRYETDWHWNQWYRFSSLLLISDTFRAVQDHCALAVAEAVPGGVSINQPGSVTVCRCCQWQPVTASTASPPVMALNYSFGCQGVWCPRILQKIEKKRLKLPQRSAIS